MRISSVLIIGVILASAVSAQSKCPYEVAKNENPQVCDGLLKAPLFSRDDPNWSNLRNSQGAALSQVTLAIASALNGIGARFSGSKVNPRSLNFFLSHFQGYDSNSQPRFDVLGKTGINLSYKG